MSARPIDQAKEAEDAISVGGPGETKYEIRPQEQLQNRIEDRIDRHRGSVSGARISERENNPTVDIHAARDLECPLDQQPQQDDEYFEEPDLEKIDIMYDGEKNHIATHENGHIPETEVLLDRNEAQEPPPKPRSWLNDIFLCWVNPIMLKGLRNKLEEGKIIPPLPEALSTMHLFQRAREALAICVKDELPSRPQKKTGTQNGENISVDIENELNFKRAEGQKRVDLNVLLAVLWSQNKWHVLVGVLLSFIHSVLNMAVRPLLIAKLVIVPDRAAYVYICFLTCAKLLAVLLFLLNVAQRVRVSSGDWTPASNPPTNTIYNPPSDRRVLRPVIYYRRHVDDNPDIVNRAGRGGAHCIHVQVNLPS